MMTHYTINNRRRSARCGFLFPGTLADIHKCQSEKAGHQHRRMAAFTFIELLVVIMIAVSLASLILGWALSARASQKVRSTQAAMGNLLLVADTVKNASPIFPDHRLANFFYVQKHTAISGAQPVWNGANYRRMGSGEFLAFLATLVSSSDTMIHSLGTEYLALSPVPWGAPAGGATVDVFEQDSGKPGALDKNATSASFSLVSPIGGYLLKMPVDAWGNPLVYRLYTHKDDLNVADTVPANGVTPAGSRPIREDIVQDEQFTRDRYVANGIAVDDPVAKAVTAGSPSSTAEYVRPAVPMYGSPMWMSAGPDGQWGAFIDGSSPNFGRDALAPDKSVARDGKAKDNVYSQEASR